MGMTLPIVIGEYARGKRTYGLEARVVWNGTGSAVAAGRVKSDGVRTMAALEILLGLIGAGGMFLLQSPAAIKLRDVHPGDDPLG
jgi:hypothetical protein